jgi:hypothetical protein
MMGLNARKSCVLSLKLSFFIVQNVSPDWMLSMIDRGNPLYRLRTWEETNLCPLPNTLVLYKEQPVVR